MCVGMTLTMGWGPRLRGVAGVSWDAMVIKGINKSNLVVTEPNPTRVDHFFRGCWTL
jgi:hypothetical protein